MRSLYESLLRFYSSSLLTLKIDEVNHERVHGVVGKAQKKNQEIRRCEIFPSMSKMLKDMRQVPFHPGTPITFVGPVASVPTEGHKPCVPMVSCLRSY